MKFVCLVNNYQYGEGRFARLRKQSAYNDIMVDKYHHIVCFDDEESAFKMVCYIINSNETHHNIYMVRNNIEEEHIIQMFKDRLDAYRQRYNRKY